MSDFRDLTLDFDISTPVRRLVPRAAHPCPAVTRTEPSPSVSSTVSVGSDESAKTPTGAAEAPVNTPPRVLRTARAHVPKKTASVPVRRGLRIRKRTLYIWIGCVLGLWLLGRPSSRPQKRALRATKHACTRHPSPAFTATCQNHCAGGTCVAEFATLACADAVRSVHVHYASGAVQRVPALYQRVPNTTMFFTGSGNRVTFQPARCDVRMGAVVVQPPETDAIAKLRSHIVWIAAATSKTFRVLRGDGSLVAEVDAHLVQDTCAPAHAPTYCVYKLEMQCQHRDAAMHVFALDESGDKSRANTFIYC